MRNLANSLHRFSQSLSAKTKSVSFNWSVLFLLTVGLTAGLTEKVQAERPESAPPQLKDTLTQIDAAANRQDLQSVMQFYGESFKNSDGLTRTLLEQTLRQLWERYPQLTYRTELQDWKTEGNAIVAETVTTVTGTQANDGTNVKLESTLRSRQRFENQKIVQQEILDERTQITSGPNPPTVEVQLPEEVRVGQSFNFDVIVQEPLGDNILLGAALEEPIKPELYSQPTNFELELLSAGGIFKLGKAPLQEEDRWISAVLVRGDGITIVTERLNIVIRPSASSGSSN